MQDQSPKPKQQKIWFILKLLFAIVILISFAPGSAWAQTPEVVPQIVTAYTYDTCGGKEWILTLEVWNVGSEGGDAYGQAVLSGGWCDNGELRNALDTYGTFSGGPNGIAVFDRYSLQFADGKTVHRVGTGGWVFIVQNPDAFATALPTPDCNALITLPANLKSGDDLWMTASYTDLDGNSLSSDTIISEAWIINGRAGVLLTSWDGNAMNIELQYTCPGGQAHTAVYNLPASQEESAPASPPEGDSPQEEPPQEQQPEVDNSLEEPGQAPPENNFPDNNNSISPLVPFIIIAAIAAIGGGAVLGGGAIIYVIAKNTGIIGGKPKIPAIRKPPVTTSPKPHQPPAPQPVAPQPVAPQPPVPPQPVSPVPPQPVTPVTPEPAGPVTPESAEPVLPEPAEPDLDTLTPAEKQQLLDQNTDLKKQLYELERADLDWRVSQRWTYDKWQKGITDYQSNASKVIFNIAKETGDAGKTVLNAPAGLINAAANEFCNQVNNLLTTPSPPKATNAEILERQRKINRGLHKKYDEATRMRSQIHKERITIQKKIDENNLRIKKNPFLTLN